MRYLFHFFGRISSVSLTISRLVILNADRGNCLWHINHYQYPGSSKIFQKFWSKFFVENLEERFSQYYMNSDMESKFKYNYLEDMYSGDHIDNVLDILRHCHFQHLPYHCVDDVWIVKLAKLSRRVSDWKLQGNPKDMFSR